MGIRMHTSVVFTRGGGSPDSICSSIYGWWPLCLAVRLSEKLFDRRALRGSSAQPLYCACHSRRSLSSTRLSLCRHSGKNDLRRHCLTGYSVAVCQILTRTRAGAPTATLASLPVWLIVAFDCIRSFGVAYRMSWQPALLFRLASV